MVTIDGDLSDWNDSDRLDRPGTTIAGYKLYGRLDAADQNGVRDYVFGITAPDKIGAGTTVWLNVDKNKTTGSDVFGNSAGSEYYVNFDANGVPALFTTADNQSVAVPVVSKTSADGKTVEFAIPQSALVGATGEINTLFEVNGIAFFPASFSSGTQLTVQDPSSLPPAAPTGNRIGIVYSATSAANYFNTTAYSQLFMAAQNQATAAGVPFDLLSEDDLTDLSKISQYKALVFPSFANVDATKVDAITDTLTKAVYDYHVGLITAGNFMTNDATGAALAGDSYARMEALLDVKRVGGPSGTVPVDIKAGASSNPMMSGYTPGEEIRTYAAVPTAYFSSVDGTGVTLATQTTSGTDNPAVIATQTGGNNVHFATESFLADSNMLQHAIDWAAAPASGPEISLHMSRDSSIVASRTDMDEAMELQEVKPSTGSPGIYDKLIPILQDWKTKYNFVGSYYIDIGNNAAAGEGTDWLVSKPYYDQIMAMGNEIGSHSVSHPEITDSLTPAQIQAEFQGSKTAIESNLGITVAGAAVPGNPETVATSRLIDQYYSYLTGGATLVGAGYPGAIGYLSPSSADAKSMYIAPDMAFDFTLIDFDSLTGAQAEAEWSSELKGLTSHSDEPVIVWPWHDYGPTMFPGVATPNYSLDMYTSFIAEAAAAGSEFVTLGDLAEREVSYHQAGVSTSYDAGTDTETVTATGPDLGKFALDVGGGKTIKNVGNWYAYDTNSVFLDKDGGTFKVAFGTTPDDVSHITVLPDRAELASLTGDGTNLAFQIVGEGNLVIDLKDPTFKQVQVTGATIASQVGDKLTLNLGAIGTHNVTVNEVQPAAPTYTVAVAPASVAEGNTAPGNQLTYTVTRTGDTSQAGSVDVVLSGTATQDDYSVTGLTGTASNQVAFAAGATSATFTVTTKPDTVVEPDETVIVTISDPLGQTGASLGATTSASGTITNDDVPPAYTVAVAPASVAEGNTAPGNLLTYTVTRTGDTSQAGSVDVTLTGTAAQDDYSVAGLTGSGSNQLAFAAGATSAVFTVTTTPDAVVEPDDTVIATISNPLGQTGASLGATTSATGTIVNDDVVPATYAVSVAPGSVAEGNAAPGNILTYTVSRTGDPTLASAIGVSFSSGTATLGSDFTVSSTGTVSDGTYLDGSLTFAAGQSTAKFLVTTIPDAAVEPDETVIATLATPTDGGTITTASATGTILNDDTAAPGGGGGDGGAGGGSGSPPSGGNGNTSTQGDDLLVGSGLDDRFALLSGNDTAMGMAGNDLVYGNQGDDLIYGNEGSDTLFGGQGQDIAFGGQGADLIYGNSGSDIIYGNRGSDTLYGGQGGDILYGGGGADVLYGGAGADTLVGGIGADTYVFGSPSGNDVIVGFNASEGDRLDLHGQSYTLSTGSDGSEVLSLSGGGTVQLKGVPSAVLVMTAIS